jgi:chloramphenicol O-acetyltransferase type A
MNYKILDMEKYYRRGVFRHFSEDCKCSISITHRIDVTNLVLHSKKSNTKFYINFLYILSKILNSREDYRLSYLYNTQEVIVYDKIHPTQYVFHENTGTCTPVYTEYMSDYKAFYKKCEQDIERAKQRGEYQLDAQNHPNWFEASYISWLSYDSLHIELPEGYLYFMPIVNWGKYREECGRMMMPVSVRLNHAAADGYLLAQVFLLLEEEIDSWK